MAHIYHITTGEAWKTALEDGTYRTESLASEGFIHCSTRGQVVGVANAFYQDVSDLVILRIDEALAGDVRYEAPAEDGYASPDDRFPHLYGPLPVEAVIQVVGLPSNMDGRYALPGDLM